MDAIIKLVKSLEESGLLIKGVSKKLKMKQKNDDFRGLLWSTLGASSLGNILAGKWVIRASEEHLELVIIFNAVWSFNKFWNRKILSE